MYYSNDIFSYLLRQSWQIALLAFAISAVCFLLRNKSAHLRYLLWLIILIKCLFPPFITVPLPVLPTEQPPVSSNAAAPVFTEPMIAPESSSSVAIETPAPVPAVQESSPVIAKQGIIDRLSQINTAQRVALIWLTGLAIFAIISAAKAVRIHLRLVKMRKQLPDKASGLVNTLFEELGLAYFPKVWLIEGIGQPFVWGLFRGSIYLPANLLDNYTSRQLKNILGHEVSHILRYDALINLLQIAAQGIFWFHPLVWWSNKKIRQEREKCCDEMAIARLGSQAKDYSAAIVNTLVNEYKSTLSVPSLAVAGPIKNIEDRIKTIMMPNKKFYKKPGVIVLLSVLLLALIAVPVTFALTNKPSQTQTPVSSKYSASLPNGVSVELVGICEDPVKGKKWWKPDGAEMEKPEYELKGEQSFQYPLLGYLLCFSPNDDVVYRSSINMKEPFFISGPVTERGQSIVFWGENSIPRYNKPETINITVEVAFGPWILNKPGRNSVYPEFTNLPDGTIILSGIRKNPEKEDGCPTLIEATTNSLNTNIELECITKDGEKLKSWNEGTLTASGNMIQHTFGFRAAVENIEKINVKYRSFKEIVFKNVSLVPGVKTDFQIEVEKSSVPAEGEIISAIKTGRVVDSDGVGVAGAILKIRKYNPQLKKSEDVPSLQTDAKGYFQIPSSLPSEFLTAAVSAEGYINRSNVAVLYQDNILLKRPSIISGKVIDPNGKPLINAPLSLTTTVQYPNSSEMKSNALRAITDESGNFTFSEVPPGLHLLYYPWSGPTQQEISTGKWKSFHSPDEKWPPAPIKGILVARQIEIKDSQKITDVTLDLSKSNCSVEGQVSDSSGRPVAGAKVYLVWKVP